MQEYSPARTAAVPSQNHGPRWLLARECSPGLNVGEKSVSVWREGHIPIAWTAGSCTVQGVGHPQGQRPGWEWPRHDDVQSVSFRLTLGGHCQLVLLKS